MPKKPTELEAAALATGWGPAQQAALYHIKAAQQEEKDEKEEIRKQLKKEEKALEEIRPEEVKGGEIVDAICPPLFDFLDLVAPPHIGISIFLLLHLVYWYTTPWYLHYFITWPAIYFIPLYCSYRSIKSGKDRALWLSYWMILAVLEYLELLLFRDQTRTLTWWPKLKALFCVTLYSIVENKEVKDSKGKVKGSIPAYGAVKFIKMFLPEPPKKEKKESKDAKDARSSSKKSNTSQSEGKSSR
ncbi:hypothetical protein L204_106370 [Cryptococcus depauperatus]